MNPKEKPEEMIVATRHQESKNEDETTILDLIDNAEAKVEAELERGNGSDGIRFWYDCFRTVLNALAGALQLMEMSNTIDKDRLAKAQIRFNYLSKLTEAKSLQNSLIKDAENPQGIPNEEYKAYLFFKLRDACYAALGRDTFETDPELLSESMLHEVLDLEDEIKNHKETADELRERLEVELGHRDESQTV